MAPDRPMHVQDKSSLSPRVLPKEGESLSPRAYKADYAIDPETGCWNWIKHRDRKGYGRSMPLVKIYGTQFAYRAYWMAANGPLEPGMKLVIDHLCRNPSCVNPKHLEAVSQATNVHRGRQAKLTMEIAREVRRRVQAGEPAGKIKDDLGVSIQNVWWIAEDRAWREDPTAPRQPVWPIKDCAWCGERIPPERGRKAKYCSDAHRKTSKNAGRAKVPS